MKLFLFIVSFAFISPTALGQIVREPEDNSCLQEFFEDLPPIVKQIYSYEAGWASMIDRFDEQKIKKQARESAADWVNQNSYKGDSTGLSIFHYLQKISDPNTKGHPKINLKETEKDSEFITSYLDSDALNRFSWINENLLKSSNKKGCSSSIYEFENYSMNRFSEIRKKYLNSTVTPVTEYFQMGEIDALERKGTQTFNKTLKAEIIRLTKDLNPTVARINNDEQSKTSKIELSAPIVKNKKYIYPINLNLQNKSNQIAQGPLLLKLFIGSKELFIQTIEINLSPNETKTLEAFVLNLARTGLIFNTNRVYLSAFSEEMSINFQTEIQSVSGQIGYTLKSLLEEIKIETNSSDTVLIRMLISKIDISFEQATSYLPWIRFRSSEFDDINLQNYIGIIQEDHNHLLFELIKKIELKMSQVYISRFIVRSGEKHLAIIEQLIECTLSNITQDND
jgi:hypothetical protein